MSRSVRKQTKAPGRTGRPRKRPDAAGPVWDRRPWCAALGIGVSTSFTLPIQPRTVKIGKLTKIIEQPAEYAERVAQLQAAKAA